MVDTVKIKKTQALVIAGLLWIGMGGLLLIKGCGYFLHLSKGVICGTCRISLLTEKLTEYTKDFRQSILILICISFVVGFLKGFFVFKKAVNRLFYRLSSLSTSPFVSLKKVYPKSYLFILLGMMGFGFIFKFTPLSFDVKGFIDFAIGFGLIYGSMFYFQAACRIRRISNK